MYISPILRSPAAAFRIPTSSSSSPLRHLHSRPPTNALSLLNHHIQHQTAPFSTTPANNLASKRRPRGDQRIALIRYHLTHPLTPRPLRLSRLRSLRHWTIHRAYLLHRRQQLISQERELERMYNSMRDACEELRTGVGDGGRLFRVAMGKKGVWRGVPVEYARIQTEGPGRGGWNAGWVR